jgi:hypothetical protein
MSYTVYAASVFPGSAAASAAGTALAVGGTWSNNAGGTDVDTDGSGHIYLGGADSIIGPSGTMPDGTKPVELLFRFDRKSALSNNQRWQFIFTGIVSSVTLDTSLYWVEPTGSPHGDGWCFDHAGSNVSGGNYAGPGPTSGEDYRITVTPGAPWHFAMEKSTDSRVTWTAVSSINATATPANAATFGIYGANGAGSGGWTSTTGSQISNLVLQDLSARTATLSGSTSGNAGTSYLMTVSLDNPAGQGGIVVSLASSGSAGVISATSGGGAITSITIAQGAASGFFWWTPSAIGTASLSITAPGVAVSGSPLSFAAGIAAAPATVANITVTEGGKPRHWVTGQSAAGSTQATAFPITNNFAFTEFSAVIAGTGAILPAAIYPSRHDVVNDGTNTLLVYPPIGGTVDGGSVNQPYSLAAGSAAIFWLTTTPLAWNVIA